MSTESPFTSGGATGFELGTDGPGVVVVACDGSPSSLHAVAYAAGEARRQRARLVCVYVGRVAYPAGIPLGPVLVPVPDVHADHAALVRLLDDVLRPWNVPYETVLRVGDPAREIRAVCRELRADAVVIGASRRVVRRIGRSLANRLGGCGAFPVTVVP